ncbi:hypothetical protein ACU6U9_10535 [Pseudomonas sp. HK3]
MNFRLFGSAIFYASILFCMSAHGVDDDPDDLVNLAGIDSTRGQSYSTEKEVVDTFSGNLNAIYTDLVVPGTGLDIRIDRHYTTEESGAMVSPIGIRWYIHFGYLQYSADRNPCFDLGGDANNNPVFVTPSGTREKIFYDYIYLDENVDGEFTENVDYKPPMYTSNLWHGECINNNEELVLSDPSGIKYYIDVRSKHISNYHAYKIEDNFGNNLLIDLSVQATSLGDMVKVNNVTASDGRIVTFNYTGSKLSTISYDDKLITYTVGSTPNILGLLESVDIGEDQKWVYTYHPYTSVFNLASVTSPLGKVVTYDYSRFPVAGIQPLMLSQKCAGEICESYSYVHSGSDGSHTTTITGTQWVKQYIHYGYRDTAPSEIWKYGLLKQSCHAKTLGACEGDDMMVSFGGNYSNDGEIQSYVWQPILISNENSNSIIFGTRFNNSNYYVPRLSTKEIKRGTNTYTTQYNYDRLGRSTGWVESGNKVRTFKQYRRDYLSRTQWFMRDASVSVSEGRSTNFSYLYEVNHDDNGQIQEEIKDGAKFNYSYNSDGSLNTVTDGVGNKTVYSRYVQGVARKIEYADASTLTRTVDSHGRITSVTDAKGIKTTYKYDDIDRKTKVDFSHGADISISYETYSDQIKAGIGASPGYSVSVTRDSLKVVQEFDSFGNETEVVKSGNAGSVAINRKYNDQNRLEFKSYPNENSKGIRYSYDTLGRIIKTKSTEGITTRVYYHNGYQVQHKDAKSHSTRTKFTAYGSPDDQYLSEVDAPEQALTNITRNVNGQPLLIKMGAVTREYKYDGNWRLWRYSDSENNAITEYIHDDAGRRVSESKITDDLKLTSIMEYDNLNRLIKITSPSYTLFEGSIRYSSPSSSECGNSCVYIKNHPSYEFSYDLNNNLIKKTKKTEKLTTRIYANVPNISLNSSSNIWNYSYDEKDNLKNETLVNGNNSYDFSYVFNDLDNLESITYPNGLKINYAPDDFGQATKVGDFVNSITYFDSGDIASLVYANGHTTRYSQNERFLPASMKIDGLLDYAYEYDPNGNITNIIDGLDGDHSASMEYDELNRLISATGEWGNGNYIYDVLGNILSKSIGAESKSYKYNDNNQLIKVGNDTILNDEFGRVIDDGRNTLSFDTDNNLIRAINNKNYNTLFFDYDAANRLITRTEGDRESRFTYTQSGKLMYEVGNDGSFKRNHIYVGNRLVAYDDTGIPCSHDADNDGLPYCFEVDNNLNPTDSTDANQDLDNDGLSNYQEYLAKTNINKADTDSDGIDDNYEVNYQLNPFFDDASQDNDNDGYSNLDEFNLNLNPNIYDKPIAVENIQFSPKKNKALIAWHYPNENFTFDIYWDTKPIVDIDDANLLANASSPVVLNNLVNDQVHYFVVSVSNVAGEKSLSSEYLFTPGIVALVNTGISLDVCDECVLWSKEDDFGNLFLLWADKTSKKLNIRRLDRSGNLGGATNLFI